MPLYQEWGPTPPNKTITKSINIAGTIPSYTQEIKIKDVIGRFPQYTTFRLIAIKSYVQPGYPAFIVPFAYSGLSNALNPTPTASAVVFEITANDNVLTHNVAFQNINLLSPNLYRFRQLFVLEGQKPGINALFQTISSFTFDTSLIINDALVLFEPITLTYDHIIGTPFQTKEITLTGNTWQLIGNPKYKLTSIDPAVYIEDQLGPDGTFQVAFGSGTAIVKVTLTSFFDIPEPDPTDYVLDYLLIKVASNPVAFASIRVKKFNTQLLDISPLTLNFEATKNIQEAAAQNILFSCNVAYVITQSPWLNATVETVEIQGISTKVIKVVPINSSNQDAGIYTGFVNVTATIDGVVTTKTATVNYTIVDIVRFPYLENQLAFTLDNKFIEILTYNTDTYMQMDTIITVFDFYTSQAKEYVIQEKIGLFKGKARVSIGKIVHQLMSKAKEINNSTFQYSPTTVRMNFFENNLSDDTTVRTDTSGTIKFLAGLSKDFQKFGFLKINHKLERVTTNSYKYLNFFTTEGLHTLKTYKNGVFFDKVDLAPLENKVQTLKVLFDQFAQGDKIEFSIYKAGFTRDNSEESAKIGFVVFPEGMNSTTINWEDEFLLKQAIECTGVYNIKGGLSFISQKIYKNLVEHLTHLESNKISKLAINTGWLMQSDVDTIESLMRSKKVWIFANGTRINLVPISESINSVDSERELIDYTLEFQINPSYNEETYSL